MNDRLTALADPAARSTSFTYDAEGNPTGVGPTARTYAYDSVGNRTSHTDATGTTAYTYDANDRPLSAGATSFTYDGLGNTLTQTGGSASFLV